MKPRRTKPAGRKPGRKASSQRGGRRKDEGYFSAPGSGNKGPGRPFKKRGSAGRDFRTGPEWRKEKGSFSPGDARGERPFRQTRRFDDEPRGYEKRPPRDKSRFAKDSRDTGARRSFRRSEDSGPAHERRYTKRTGDPGTRKPSRYGEDSGPAPGRRFSGKKSFGSRNDKFPARDGARWNRKEKHSFYGEKRKPAERRPAPAADAGEGLTRLNKFIA